MGSTINYLTYADKGASVAQYQYVQIGFSPERLDELDSLADENDISRSELVRQLVEGGLNE